MSDLYSLQATVTGRVQGVYFRAFVAETALKLSLTGYVRNLPDGSVEVRAEGEKQQLERLFGYLKSGPPHARVENVETGWQGYTGDYSGFTIRY
ncbi:acylphosphatase [Chloroflexota bacterium]